MFDIDGTLVESYDMDSQCFVDAVRAVTGISIDSDWSKYKHVTDAGILSEVIRHNGISDEQAVHAAVKEAFIAKLEAAIKEYPVREVHGASHFLSLLNSMSNVVVSVATGGWQESAELKLQSAGIDVSSLAFASSSDHVSRIDIMKTAAARARVPESVPCTYFGDGGWDKAASQQLGFEFVLIGDKLEHAPAFNDFTSSAEILAYVGL